MERSGVVRTRAGLAVVAVCLAAMAAFFPPATASSVEANPRSVTVSKSTGLSGGDEITVTWTGFSPGSATVLQCDDYDGQPLARENSCVGRNRVSAVTGADGTGSATIRLRVDTTNSGLRCYRGYPCAVVVAECGFDLASRAAFAPISFDELPQFDDNFNVIGGGGDPPPPPVVPEPPPQEPPPTSRPTVNGGGSSAANAAAALWQKDVRLAPVQPIDVGYTAINSPSGLGSKNPATGRWTGFVGGEFDFALSGIPLSGEQRKELEDQGRGAVLVPLVANALTLAAYGTLGQDKTPVTSMRFSAQALLPVYSGDDLGPNAEKIRADNMGCLLVTPGIVGTPPRFLPTYRQDQSNANLTLTSWLTAETGTSRFPVSERFDASSTYRGALGDEALAKVIFEGPRDTDQYTIGDTIRLGYVDLSSAKSQGLAASPVKNRYGAFVLPTAASVGQAVKGAEAQEDGSLSFDRADPNPGVYPLTSITYAVVPTTLTDSFTAEKGAVLRDFLTYAISTQGQAKAASLGYFGLPPELLKQAADSIAKIPTSEAPPTEVVSESPPAGAGDTGSAGFAGAGDSGAASSLSGGESVAAPADGGATGLAAPVQEPVPGAPDQAKRPVPIGASRLLQGGGLVPPLPLLFALGLLLVLAGQVARRRAKPPV